MYNIPIENVPELLKKLSKINRKATKIGCPQVEVYMVGAFDVINKKEGTAQRYIELVVEGERPAIKGWKFVATLQYVEGQNIVRTVPGETVDLKFREAKPVCDHCKTLRYRKETYVIQHIETGEYKQVGRNCLADFFENGVQPQEYAAWLEVLQEADELARASESRGEKAALISAERFLEACAEATLRFGFVSRTKAQAVYEEQHKSINTTAHVAGEILFPTKYTPEEYRNIKISPEAERLARDAMAWAETWRDNEDLNDYLHNLGVVTRMAAISWRETGLLASLIGAYQRHLETEEERKRKEEAQAFYAAQPGYNKFYGEKGDKIELELEVINKHEIAGDYGITTIHHMRSKEGYEFVWFASNADLELGWHKIRGTIKDHQARNGYNKTVLTRCKVVD